MITIIHGTDTGQSRKYFTNLLQNSDDGLLIDGKVISITDLVQIFGGGELFTIRKNFFIENLFVKRSRGAGNTTGGKKNTELHSIIEYLKNNEKDNNIYIWESSELTKSTLNIFKDPIIRLFKLPQTLFTFLDNIKPGNGKVLVNLFHQTIEVSDPEMVFFMIVRQIRLLLCLIEPSNEAIDEIRKISPWQKSRLQNQADFFEFDELKSLYAKLFEIEIGLKTGGLSSTLVQAIDFLLLDI